MCSDGCLNDKSILSSFFFCLFFVPPFWSKSTDGVRIEIFFF